jgi:cytochrome c oxidase subunit 2
MTWALMLLMALLAAPPRTVEISAKRFDFTPNEVHLKAGEPVTIHLVSSDRAHGLMVKPLGLDLDSDDNPSATITPAQTGRFTAICDHYCGMGHGGMKMVFVVE